MDPAARDEFDHLFVVSDLHVGGLPGTREVIDECGHRRIHGAQMFAQGHRLGALFTHLALGAYGQRCIVIAGDFLDSLPFLPPGQYLDIDNAVSRLTQLGQDEIYAPVFAGLSAICAAGHRLVILLGNHDLELAFAPLQEALLTKIGGTRQNVRFLLDGCGYTCIAGGRRVYVTHGNEADPWNHVDHEQLRRARHRQTLGLPFYKQDWQPNAGTALVVDAMNAVKAIHPFVDLLKPEMAAAVPTVAAIDPGQLARAMDAGTALKERLRAATGPPLVLGAEGEPVVMPERDALLLDAVRSLRPRGDAGEVEALWRRIDDVTVTPSALVADAGGELGYFSFLTGSRSPAEKASALRMALRRWTANDRSFALDDADEVCKGVLSQLGSGFDVAITGHTHLPRWLDPGLRPGVTYLNTGTWARVMRLPPEVLADDAAFAPVYAALTSGDIHQLDTLTVATSRGPTPVLLDATLAAHVGAGPTGPVTELLRVSGVTTVGGTPDGSPLTLTPLDRQRWPER